MAYSAATGTQLWVSRYDGHDGTPAAIAVGPAGRTVFVTGDANVSGTHYDYVTIAYDAATGARLWHSVFTGPVIGPGPATFAQATSVAVSPGGHTVYVTGTSQRRSSGQDYLTIAYDGATGARRWLVRYNGKGNGNDTATAVAASPDGRSVFVTGRSTGAGSQFDYATVAYRAATGYTLWVTRYNGPAGRNDLAIALAVAPDGGAVYITGSSHRASSEFAFDYATVAYRAATGAQLRATRYGRPSDHRDVAAGLAVGPRGRELYVTGTATGARGGLRDYVTAAYGAASGTLLWVRRYNGPSGREDTAAAVVASPAGRRIFVTGSSRGAATYFDYATLAYAG